MRLRGSGGSKGGGSSNGPVESPNTLQSRATARLIDLISEGEVEGLVGGLQGVYLDDTPIQNADGSFNFTNIVVEARAGTPDQASIPGFPAVESVFAVGSEVKQAAPVVRAVANSEATAVLVTIRLDGLQSVDAKTGNINATSVQIGIDVQLDGGAFVDVTPTNAIFSGKTNTAYQRSFRIQRPGDGDWSIRVRRITADNASSLLTNKTYWDSVTEIEDYQLQYPYSALIAYQVDAQSFGGRVPKRLARVRGVRMRVPANYTPRIYDDDGNIVSDASYDGIWDGTFKTVWHNNAAWTLFECIANDRWGIGEYVPDAFRDKWTIYAIGQYCDETVPDGLGGYEPRYTFNFAISSAEDAFKALTSIASVFRGMIYWGSVGITATADRDLDPVKLVTPANVIGGMISWGGGSLRQRHTAAVVTWYDPDDYCRPAIEVVEASPADIERFGYRAIEVVAFGCTSRGQAHRYGLWILETERSEAETCTWQASWDHADVYPGEIVEVQDPSYAGVEFGGRVAGLIEESGAVVGLVLDRPIDLEAGKTYELSVTLSDGMVARRPLTTPAGTTTNVAFAAPLMPPPIVNAVWVLSSSDVSPRRVKVIKRVETASNLFDLSGILHDPAKYARIERGLALEPPTYTALPSGPIKPPSEVVVSECVALVSGTARPKTMVSWVLSPDPRVVDYEVQIKPATQNWQPSSPQFSNQSSIDLFDLGAGTFAFRVRALDSVGRPSTWVATDDATLAGLEMPPNPVSNLRDTYITGRSNLIWDDPQDFRDVGIEIRKGTTFEAAQTVADYASSPWQTVGDDTYFVAAYIVTAGGTRVYSVTVPSILIQGSVAVENVVVSHDERAEGWDGYFGGSVGKDVSGGNYLRTSGDKPFLDEGDFLSQLDFLNRGAPGGGIYWSKYVVNIGRKGLCRISNDWTATGVPIGDDFLAGTDFLFPPDFLKGYLAQFIRVRPVIRISDTGPGDAFSEENLFVPDNAFLAGAIWKEPQVWSPDVYAGWLFQLGMEFEILDPSVNVIAYLLSWTWTVDVPDRFDSYQNLDIPADGLRVVFRPTGSTEDAPFNGGLNNEPLPHVTPSIQNPTPGDEVVWEGLSLSEMTLFVKNDGVKVARMGNNVNALVRGY
ncbi:MAG: host specificity protein J [Afipia sp.]|nr:host specificity protein J [Afipia sp.]OJW65474.1 MAG: hypothetical protein BGO65_12150 [Afipia sp. 64-13]